MLLLNYNCKRVKHFILKQKEDKESLKNTANFTPTVWAASLVIRARVLMRVVHRRWVCGSKT